MDAPAFFQTPCPAESFVQTQRRPWSTSGSTAQGNELMAPDGLETDSNEERHRMNFNDFQGMNNELYNITNMNKKRITWEHMCKIKPYLILY